MGKLAHIHEGFKLMLLIGLSLLGATLVGLILAFISYQFLGLDFEVAMYKNQVFGLVTLSANLIGMFLLPSIILYGLFKTKHHSYISFEKTSFLRYLSCIGIIVLIQMMAPFVVEATAKIFDMMGMLEWAEQATKNQTKGLEELLMNKSGVGIFILKIFAVSITPAICEEFFFRGMLTTILKRWIKNMHIAIIISSALFSMLHFQPFNFVIFFILGMVFGYIYWLTKNIWLPVMMHFIFNLTSLIGMEFFV